MVSEATHRWRKPGKHAQSQSIARKDSILTNPTLPQELIAAILVRLPVKYLLPFKCVSKDWYALISCPDFVKAHLRFSAKDYTRHKLLMICRPSLRYCDVSSVFCKTYTTETYDFEHTMKPPYRRYPFVVGSVNGLICLGAELGALALCNPSMRKFKELPAMPNPTFDFKLYGFGYDEVHDDYKAVVISMKTTREGHAYIFSLKSDSWRRVEDFHYGGPVLGSLATLANEKLYWINGDIIVSFDLVDEKWEKVDQPCCRAGDFDLTLGSLGGEFCVLYNYRGTHHDIWADLWVMKKYGVKESWTKLCTIKYPDNSPNYVRFAPLCMSNEGELLLRVNFNSTLAVYNPNDDSKRYRRVANVDGIIAVLLYMESLVCPILQNELRSEQDFVKQEGQA